MGLNGPHFELIFLDDMVYESCMGFQFTFVHKGVLVITLGYRRISEQYIWIGLVD